MATSSTTQALAGAPTSLQQELSKLPKLPHKPVDITKLWILWYRHSVNPHAQFKCFEFDGDLRAAVVRCQKHCEVMGFRFIMVRPFVVDLTDEEVNKVESWR